MDARSGSDSMQTLHDDPIEINSSSSYGYGRNIMVLVA
ncbi:MAG: hypothetical protein ACD_76C00068G0001 [uncultured bacterium]|nr:MAG: hypothetical protein ACD_76C00068G0001 [uncultured bacterium]